MNPPAEVLEICGYTASPTSWEVVPFVAWRKEYQHQAMIVLRDGAYINDRIPVAVFQVYEASS